MADAPDRSRGRGTIEILHPALSRELWGWCALAIGSLAIAGTFAFLLALSRVPGVETVFHWPLDFFHKGLVIHVIFSFVVWFLAVLGALLVLATDRVAAPSFRGAGLGRAGVLALAAALPLLFVPALLNRGEATLNNYIPAIIDPLYYAGLITMALALALPGLRLLINLPGRQWARQPLLVAPAAMVVTYLIALASFAVALSLLAGQAPSHAFHEELFWGGGHVLQILNTQMLVIAWAVLAGAMTHEPSAAGWRQSPVGGATALAGLALAAVALLAPAFYLIYQPFAAEQTRAFTNLQYALGPAWLVVAAAIVVTRKPAVARPKVARPKDEPTQPTKSRFHHWADDGGLARLCLLCSGALFVVGGGFGLFVDGGDTRTPAHYHGVIAAVTLAFMGLFYIWFLPALSRPLPRQRPLRLQVALFSAGQLIACIGLFMAGGFGAPRKTAGEAQNLQEVGAVIGMWMNGIGALIAIIGGIMFIWIAGRALTRWKVPADHAQADRAQTEAGVALKSAKVR